VLARLGSGAFGQVYRAIHPRSGHVVAIKLLDHPLEAAESQRVITEARAAATIRHPNVVSVYDLGITADRRPFIVMEYLEGQTLADTWQGRVPSDDVVRIATDVLRGLAAAHRLGIVHRDLKPANVFVVQPHRVVIVDFGLAKLLADPRTPTVTIAGTSLGTPRYMSPEQIRGKEIDGRTDLYALGVMMYEAIAGEPPFSAASTFQLLEAHIEKPPPGLAADLPRNLADVIDRALAKSPADRFADADTMRRALRDGPVKPRRIAPLLFALAGMLAVAAIAIGVTRHHGARSKPAPKPTVARHPAPTMNQLVLTPRDQQVVDTIRYNVRSMPLANVEAALCGAEQNAELLQRVGKDPYKPYFLHELATAYRTDPRTEAISCSESMDRR